MTYIQRYYNLDEKKLKIFTCNFNMFYRLMSKFDNKVYFRLVPDLKEVSQLIKTYRYFRNISFHKKQRYGRNYFQGQPLYLIKGESCYISKKQPSEKYNLAFTNYNEAISIYNKLRSQITGSWHKKPNLVVYNLEHFIKDQINSNENYVHPFLIIPSYKSYAFTKNFQLSKSRQLVYNTLLQTASSIQLWSKRIFWSLTSRKP